MKPKTRPSLATRAISLLYSGTEKLRLMPAILAAALALAAAAARGEESHPWMVGYEGSQSCSMCHPIAASQVMQTKHWKWEHTDDQTAQKLGKRNMINNFCISLPSNEPRCTSCHVGWGYSDKNFNFNDPTKVDCLVCHDTTGTYKKFPAGSGLPVTGQPREFPAGSGTMWPVVDLGYVARNVGLPSRANCGACHFYAGGGDAVKHGDLDSTMTNPTRQLDVHMGVDGRNFNCADCHSMGNHQVRGTRFSKPYTDDQSCQRCHTATPHVAGDPALNEHTARVACQTCHIPAFARGGKATKMVWDWSTAGQRNAQGRNFVITNSFGEAIYDTQKGNFVWERNVVPEYVWFDGGVDYISLDDPVDGTQVVSMNKLRGSIESAKAKIFPVKRFVGRQPFDAGANRLALPHLFPINAADTNAYWKVFDWNRSLRAGMEYVGRTFSGEVGWVDTEMFRIQNHMVAPRNQALTCTSCHVPAGRLNFAALGYGERARRLQNMFGFEMSMADYSPQHGTVRIRCASETGNRYRLQVSNDLRAWSELPQSEQGAGEADGELSWIEPLGPGEQVRFYRIVRLGNQP